MNSTDRVLVYHQQSGRKELTAKQLRRLKKKARRAAKKAAQDGS